MSGSMESLETKETPNTDNPIDSKTPSTLNPSSVQSTEASTNSKSQRRPSIERFHPRLSHVSSNDTQPSATSTSNSNAAQLSSTSSAQPAPAPVRRRVVEWPKRRASITENGPIGSLDSERSAAKAANTTQTQTVKAKNGNDKDKKSTPSSVAKPISTVAPPSTSHPRHDSIVSHPRNDSPSFHRRRSSYTRYSPYSPRYRACSSSRFDSRSSTHRDSFERRPRSPYRRYCYSPSPDRRRRRSHSHSYSRSISPRRRYSPSPPRRRRCNPPSRSRSPVYRRHYIPSPRYRSRSRSSVRYASDHKRRSREEQHRRQRKRRSFTLSSYSPSPHRRYTGRSISRSPSTHRHRRYRSPSFIRSMSCSPSVQRSPLFDRDAITKQLKLVEQLQTKSATITAMQQQQQPCQTK